MTSGRHPAPRLLSALTGALIAGAFLLGLVADARAQGKPEGEMRWALYVTVAPAWLDPGEVLGFITPFWIQYALHDALVRSLARALPRVEVDLQGVTSFTEEGVGWLAACHALAPELVDGLHYRTGPGPACTRPGDVRTTSTTRSRTSAHRRPGVPGRGR